MLSGATALGILVYWKCATVPEQQQVAIRMRHLEGRGIDDITSAMNKTPAAVAGLIRRGLQTLRERLGGETCWL